MWTDPQKCSRFVKKFGELLIMTSDIDIYLTANELIKQHGDDAPIHAAMRAYELLDAGDTDGQAVWKQILAAVEEEELLSEDKPDGTQVH